MTCARSSILLFLILVVVPLSGRPPARTTQLPSSEEPPLADQAAPSVPAVEGAAELVDPPTPHVSIRVRVPASATPGQDLSYRLCVRNQSQAAAHHVTVRCLVPTAARFVRATPEPTAREAEVVWRLGTMPPGGCRQLLLVLQPTGGDLSLCARVAFEHGQCVVTRVGQGGTPAPPPPPPPPSGTPGLSIRKTGPAQVALNQAVNYRVEVVNTGSTPLTDVAVTDILPAGFRFDEGQPEPERENRRSLLRWNLGRLNAGETRVIEYRVLALQMGSFTNRAVVTAAGGFRQESSATLTVGQPKLTLRLVAPEKRYANLPAVYELTVRNNGDVPAANVVLTNPLPANSRFVSASDEGRLLEGEVRWLLGTLAAGAKKTVKLQLSAQAAGDVVNRASARADGELTAQAEATTRFEGVAGLTARLRLAGKTHLEVGEQGEYVLELRNTGTEAAGDVRVRAVVPVELEAIDAQGPTKHNRQPNEVTFEPFTLKAGELATYSVYVKALKTGDVRFRVQITSSALSAGPLLEEAGTPIVAE